MLTGLKKSLCCTALLLLAQQALAQLPGEASLGQREMRYLYINGETVDVKENPARLKELVEAGKHREVSGLKLPDGYSQIYPEDVESYAKQFSGFGGWFKTKAPGLF